MSDRMDWGARLKALRVRTQMKQADAAARLGISQAYISRLEAGGIKPSEPLARRLEALFAEAPHRAYFDHWRATVRHCQGLSSLIRLEDGAIRAVEFSAGFKALGGVFEVIAPGQALDGLFARSTDALFEILCGEGLFEGAIAGTQNMWCSADGGGAVHFDVVNIAVRDDLGAWCVHSTHREVPADAFQAWQRANERPMIIGAV